MIALGNGDKLMSRNEVLAHVRGYLNGETPTVQEVTILSIALDESPDFIEGALRTKGQ